MSKSTMPSLQEDLGSLVKSEYQDGTLTSLLSLSALALLGINDNAAAALKLIDINSIFDLATSDVFSAAIKILDAGTNTKSLMFQHGSATADLLRETVSKGTKIDEVRFLGIAALQRVPEQSAATISQALDVKNIRDLALYPPYRAASRILNAVYFPENEAVFDPEQPPDLLPKNGEYPTERVQYSTLVMDEIKLDEKAPQIDITGDNFKPLDLARLALGDSGFQHVAFGALIHLNQSWFAQGVTLGHLLHSVSLAPGESTRIAVVDWTRKSKAGETEVIQDEDQLSNDTSHNRAMNEVTAATANDAQSGFSASQQNSSSQSASVSASASASYFGLASISISGNYSTASSQAAAESYSTSSGHRDIGSQMVQNVNDRTHQNAHSTRSRRAAVVKEVSQSEHEAISTRVLANYNHMHALTIQYYEVVQIYKTKVSVSKIDKVVFIPVKLLDFQDDALIRRFRGVLSAASPTPEVRSAIENLDVIELVPAADTIFTWLGAASRLGEFRFNPLLINSALLNTVQSATQPLQTAAPVAGATTAPTVNLAPFQARLAISDKLWNTTIQTSRLSGILSIDVLRQNSDSLFLPTDAVIEGAAVDAEGVSVSLSFRLLSGAIRDNATTDSPIPMIEVQEISVKGSSSDRNISAHVVLTLNRNGVRFPLDLPAVTILKGTATVTKIVTVNPGAINTNVKKFLSENSLYYSTAVFRSLNTTQIALLLSGYTVKIKERIAAQGGGVADQITERAVPVSQVVEPRPIRYVGNYLAFKMNPSADDPDWAAWLELRGLEVGQVTEDIVPLPSGGTFAEAVLGRYNCAEKLDITRFWNWQDSPTPLLPSDIAAIQTGQHSTADGLSKGSLGAPIINMAPSSSLPDPAGTAAVLSAIQSGNMFRDMSGLQGTIGLVQSGAQGTNAAATSAAQQAGINMANQLQADTERQRIEAGKQVALVGAAGNNSKGGQNHSQDGAKINYFDSMKEKAGANPRGNSSGSGAGSGGSSSGSGTSSSSRFGSDLLTADGSSSGFDNSNGGDGFSKNPAALAATWGDGASQSSLLQAAIGNSSNPQFQLVSGIIASSIAAAKPWMDLIEFTVPASIVSDLSKRSIYVQSIDDALSYHVNLDFYPVQIDKFPTVSGHELSPKEFLAHVRTHINDFIDNSASRFYPLDTAIDDPMWKSSSPLGAVLGIKIPLDSGAVVVAEVDDTHWRFATVRTHFWLTGSHPVSGVREFGIRDGGGDGAGAGAVFYTRGADRATEYVEAMLEGKAFEGGRKLWLSLQKKIVDWVNDPAQGGKASVAKDTQKLVPWMNAQEYLQRMVPSGAMPWL